MLLQNCLLTQLTNKFKMNICEHHLINDAYVMPIVAKLSQLKHIITGE